MLAEAVHGLLRRVLAEHHGHRVAGDELEGEHDDEDDPEQNRDGEQQSPERERQRSSHTFPRGRKYSTGWTPKPLTEARVATISMVL